jgi:S-adenosyl-L-methionine hydrolase (adenosine-forming)
VLPVTFLSDYGHRDEFVGVCHGVIERIAPGAVVIDLSHELAPHDIRGAALVLRNALPYVPRGVHLAVVDPGVGTPRIPLAVRSADGHLFVGPDNGLLWPAIQRCGGVEIAFDIAQSPYRLEPVSATFHGRDLFAPIAARLALETPIERVGTPVPADDVTVLDLPRPRIQTWEVGSRVLAVDRFGNLQLNVTREHLHDAGFVQGDALRVQVSRRRRRAVFGRTFADAPRGEAVLYEDSTGAIAVALNGGSAAEALAAAADDEVKLAQWHQGH